MTTTPTRPARLMSTADLSELLGVEQRTIERWRRGTDGPPFMAFGRTIRYHPARVQQWMLAREQGTPTSKGDTPPSRGGTPPSKGGTPRTGTPRGR